MGTHIFTNTNSPHFHEHNAFTQHRICKVSQAYKQVYTQRFPNMTIGWLYATLTVALVFVTTVYFVKRGDTSEQQIAASEPEPMVLAPLPEDHRNYVYGEGAFDYGDGERWHNTSRAFLDTWSKFNKWRSHKIQYPAGTRYPNEECMICLKEDTTVYALRPCDHRACKTCWKNHILQENHYKSVTWEHN